MGVQQIGLGTCSIHGTPILSQVGIKDSRICFACLEDAKEKTGRTVVVTEDSADASGKVTVTDVSSKQGISALPSPPKTGEIVIKLSVSALAQSPTEVLLKAAYDAIDNMPPFATLKETKQAIALQDELQDLLTPKKARRKTVIEPELEGE